MEEITIKLSDTPNKMYGKPLKLLDGMIKTVKYTNEVKILLNEGVIEPAVPEVQDIPEADVMKEEKHMPMRSKKKVVSRLFR